MDNYNLTHAFYGDQVRWFIGVVEEVGTDVPRLGRVRVRIYGVHDTVDKVPISDLPQAQVLVPTTEPGVSGLGRNPYLEKGATVFGIFLDGKASQLPLVLGSIPVIEVPTGYQLENSTAVNDLDAFAGAGDVVFKSGRRTANNNTATISSAKYGGTDITESAEYPSSLETRKQMAWEFFISKGWSPAATAGIIGNLIAESNLNPGAVGDINLGGSFGIAQWYSGVGRDQLLKEYAKSRGTPWNDYITQLEFVDYELNRYSGYGGASLKAATNPTQAALIFQRKYEIPALTGRNSPIDGKPERLHEGKRVNYAIDIYNTFTRGT